MLASSEVVAFAPATDLSRARMFYQQALGLPLIRQDDFACVFDANGTMLRITAVPEVSPAGYTVLGWRVTDFEGMVRVLPGRAWYSPGTTAWTKTSTASGRPGR